MDAQPTPDQARDQLERAGTSAARLRGPARWTSTYMAGFALGFAGLTLAVGLLQPTALRVAVLVVGWALFTGVMVLWSRTRRVDSRGAGRRMAPAWTLAAVLYAVAIAVGAPDRGGDTAYWGVAAAVVATPLLVGAIRERRA